MLATIVSGCDRLVLANYDEDDGVVAVETSTNVSYAQRAETLMRLSIALLNWSIGCNFLMWVIARFWFAKWVPII